MSTNPNTSTTSITVPVPDDRVAEFYQFFGQWLAGTFPLARTPETPASPSEPRPAPTYKHWGNTEADLEDAALLWSKFSPRARKMFSLLIDNPEKRFTGEEIAEAVNIPNGAHGVAGVLAWPGRHGAAIGRLLPSIWDEDEETEETYYWMSEERADLFRAARERAEGTAA